MDDDAFNELFTRDADVVFAFHGYPRALHELIHGRPTPERFHVRGFRGGHHDDAVRHGGAQRDQPLPPRQQAVRRARRRPDGVDGLLQHCDEMLAKHRVHIREHFDDLPEVRDWVWTD